MAYEKRNFEHLFGISGFSDNLLAAHFGLYEGYVSNVEKLFGILAKLSKEGKFAAPEYAEIKRRLGWEWNGMRLHEYYFGNLSKEKTEFDEDSILGIQIKKDFGTFSDWKKEFAATGAMRGIGWVILYFDPAAQKFFNVWVNEHDAGHFSGAYPILVMDVFEHAYIADYETRKADYIEAFMGAIDWKVVGDRYDWATKIREIKPAGIDHLGCRC